MNPTSPLLVPFFGMMLTTFLVWIFMYIRRLSWIFANRVPSHQISTPEKMSQVLPEAVNHASNNLKNLFELPVLFYVVCLFLLISSKVDSIHLYCAYGFFLFRTVHSAIHCTVNIVPLRFMAYLISAICLWTMVFRCALLVLF